MKKLITLSMVWLLACLSLHAMDTPLLSTPNDGASITTGQVFNWGAASTPTPQHYHFQIDTSPNFNSGQFREEIDAYVNSSGANWDTEAEMLDLLFGTKYYWRVRAYATGDTSPWSPVRSNITRDDVGYESLATYDSTVWTGVGLNWGVHRGVRQYNCQIDTSPNFDSPVFRQITHNYINSTDGNGDTRWDIEDLLFGAKYYWRARAINNNDTSGWGAGPYVLYTADYVTYKTADSVVTWTGTSLDWAPHDGVDKYDFQADTTPNFNSPALETGQHTYINGTDGNTDTYWPIEDILFGQLYYWRVRAINAVDTSSWGEGYRRFHTRNYVSLNSPADGAVNRNTAGFTLEWDAHHGVDVYQVQMDTLYDFSAPLLDATTSYVNTSSANADTRYATGALAANTIYFWRVRAWNGHSDTSRWTQWAFNTGPTAIVYPAAPIPTSPANGTSISGNTTTLTWTSVANATGYYYEYSTSPGFGGSTTGTSNTNSANIGGLQYGVTYYWHVKAVNGNLPSGWDSVFTFTVSAGDIATDNVQGSPFCTGAPLMVTYTATGAFTASTVFTAQLSDASGSFASPTAIGTNTGIVFSFITAILPANAATGSGYKVRVVSATPSVTGAASAQAFTIVNNNTAPTINGPLGTVCVGTAVTLSTPTVNGATYSWTGPNSFTSSNQNVTFNNVAGSNAGQYGLTVKVANCTSPSASFTLNVNSTPPSAPTLGALQNPVCQGSNLDLTSTAVLNATYGWSGPNSFTSSQQNPTVTNIAANGGGTYTLVVTENSCSASASINVTVKAKVTTSFDTTICNGGTYLGHSTSGNYTQTYNGSNGCDSVHTLNLTVLNAITTTINHSICAGQSYLGHTTAGNYTDNYTSVNGCDSARTLVLTVSGGVSLTETVDMCNFDSVLIGGIYRHTAGTYKDTLRTPGACDTITTVTLNVYSSPAPVTISYDPNDPDYLIATQGYDGYQWFKNGSALQLETNDYLFLQGNGSYYVRVETFTTDCYRPSNVIVVGPVGTITTSNVSPTTYCSGSSITVGFTTTATFSSGSTFKIELSDASGGFGTPVVIGSATGASVTSVNGTIPSNAATGASYKVRIVSTSPAVTGSANTQAFSIVNVNTAPTVSGPASVCAGSNTALSVPTVPGATYNWTGPNSFTANTATATINNAAAANAGQYSVTVQVSGCNSPTGTKTLSVTNPPAAPTISTNNNPVCENHSITITASTISNATYDWSGPNGYASSLRNPTIASIAANGAGVYTVTATQNGCSVTASVTITVTPAITKTIDTTVCFGSSVLGHTTSGVYANTFTAASGCDSIRTLNLTVRPENKVIINQSICTGQSFEGHSTSGTYTDHFTAVSGCDSTRVLILVVSANITKAATAAICQGDSIMLGGTYRKAAGAYKDTLHSISNCDTIVTTTLTVSPRPATPTITVDNSLGIILKAPAGFADYTWYRDGVEVISLGNDQIIATQSGDYYCVVANQQGCTAQSNTVAVDLNGTGIAELKNLNVHVYPNPTDNIITIEVAEIQSAMRLSVKDLTGREILSDNITATRQQIDLSAYCTGTYILIVNGNNAQSAVRVFKRN